MPSPSGGMRTLSSRTTIPNTHPTLRLTHLPAEIEDLIIKGLEPSAALALSRVSRYYHQTVSLHRLDKERVNKFLHSLEMKKRRRDSFACYSCLKLKPAKYYPPLSFLRKKRQGKGGSKRFERKCWACVAESDPISSVAKRTRSHNHRSASVITKTE